MDSHEKFSLLNGKNWCRACGGVFLKVNTVQKPLPELLYPRAGDDLPPVRHRRQKEESLDRQGAEGTALSQKEGGSRRPRPTRLSAAQSEA